MIEKVCETQINTYQELMQRITIYYIYYIYLLYSYIYAIKDSFLSISQQEIGNTIDYISHRCQFCILNNRLRFEMVL